MRHRFLAFHTPRRAGRHRFLEGLRTFLTQRPPTSPQKRRPRHHPAARLRRPHQARWAAVQLLHSLRGRRRRGANGAAAFCSSPSTEARTRAAGCCWSQWRQRRTRMHELSVCVTCKQSLGEVGGEAPFLRGFGAKVKATFLMSRFLNARE